MRNKRLLAGLIVLALLILMVLFPRKYWPNSWPITFDWDQTTGFKNARVDLPAHPSISKLMGYLILWQAKPRIASYFQKSGWKSGRGTCYVVTLGAVPVVLGLDRTAAWEITDPYKTPLMFAAEAGDLGRVKTLLAEGANPNAQDQLGRTALMHAFQGGQSNPNLVRALVSAGANIDRRDRTGRTALHWAAEVAANVETLEILIQSGADVNLQTNDGDTALILAVGAGPSEDAAIGPVKALVSSGAKIDTRNAHGDTALTLAKRYGQIHIAEFLEKASANA